MKPRKQFFDVSINYKGLSDLQKSDWRVVGKAFQEPDGKIIVVMGGTPFQNWDGTLVLFPARGKDDEERAS